MLALLRLRDSRLAQITSKGAQSEAEELYLALGTLLERFQRLFDMVE